LKKSAIKSVEKMKVDKEPLIYSEEMTEKVQFYI